MSSLNPKYKFDAFICYPGKYRVRARKLFDVLDKKRALNIWIDDRLFKGRSLSEEIESAVEASFCLLVIVGKTGLNKWQRLEINHFINRRGNSARILTLMVPPLDRRGLEILLADSLSVHFASHTDSNVLEKIGSVVKGDNAVRKKKGHIKPAITKSKKKSRSNGRKSKKRQKGADDGFLIY